MSVRTKPPTIPQRVSTGVPTPPPGTPRKHTLVEVLQVGLEHKLANTHLDDPVDVGVKGGKAKKTPGMGTPLPHERTASATAKDRKTPDGQFKQASSTHMKQTEVMRQPKNRVKTPAQSIHAHQQSYFNDPSMNQFFRDLYQVCVDYLTNPLSAPLLYGAIDDSLAVVVVALEIYLNANTESAPHAKLKGGPVPVRNWATVCNSLEAGMIEYFEENVVNVKEEVATSLAKYTFTRYYQALVAAMTDWMDAKWQAAGIVKPFGALSETLREYMAKPEMQAELAAAVAVAAAASAAAAAAYTAALHAAAQASAVAHGAAAASASDAAAAASQDGSSNDATSPAHTPPETPGSGTSRFRSEQETEAARALADLMGN
jgi:hypothetical protein